MLICIDVGNTNIVLGICDDDNFKTFRLSTKQNITSDELGIQVKMLLNALEIKDKNINFIVSSVVPALDFVIKEMCKKYFDIIPVFVAPGIKSGIKIRLDNPKELGADILVGAVAASEIYGPKVLVIDIGTAMTVVYVNERKELLGGLIFPGMKTAFSSLISSTAKLEDFAYEKSKSIIGKDTKTCLQSGMFFGYSSLVEGIIKKFNNELGEFKVVFTGGEAFILRDSLENSSDYIFDGDLLMKGLKIIYEKNK